MLKLSFLLAAAAGLLAFPAAQAMTSTPGSGVVAQGLLQRVNSGPDGRITRRVQCVPGSRAGLAFSCQLESVRSTTIRVDFVVGGGSLRTVWEPLAG